MTPEQMVAWRQGHLDARCVQCGETMPARRVCWHCHSTDLEYREHLKWPDRSQPRPVQWCEQRKHYPTSDPGHPMSAKNRALREARKE